MKRFVEVEDQDISNRPRFYIYSQDICFESMLLLHIYQNTFIVSKILDIWCYDVFQNFAGYTTQKQNRSIVFGLPPDASF